MCASILCIDLYGCRHGGRSKMDSVRILKGFVLMPENVRVIDKTNLHIVSDFFQILFYTNYFILRQLYKVDTIVYLHFT